MSEHPGLLEPGEFDLVGFAVGVVDRDRRAAAARAGRRSHRRDRESRACVATATRSRVPRCSTAPGATLDGPAWPGAHHSLGRGAAPAERRSTRPRCCDLAREVDVHAFAHVTGGGIPGNLARVLPDRCDAVVRRGDLGGAAHLRRDPARGRRRRPTRWSTCSTWASACSRSSPPATRWRRSTPSGRRDTTPGSSARSSTAGDASTSCATSDEPGARVASHPDAIASSRFAACARWRSLLAAPRAKATTRRRPPTRPPRRSRSRPGSATPATRRRSGRLQAPQLKELSGLAASRQHAGVLWAHNDSGDSARDLRDRHHRRAARHRDARHRPRDRLGRHRDRCEDPLRRRHRRQPTRPHVDLRAPPRRARAHGDERGRRHRSSSAIPTAPTTPRR